MSARPLPPSLVDEIRARVEYAGKSRWERLCMPPPPGWPGGWAARRVAPLARLAARLAAPFRKRAEETPG